MAKLPKSENDLKKRIAAACVGLVFISETDSLVEPFFGKKPSDSKSVEVDFEKFFDRLTTAKDWHTKADRKNTSGFLKLKNLLKSELEDLHVYKSGNLQIEILVLGQDSQGKTAGVKMRAVET